jgi:hypothetical protein
VDKSTLPEFKNTGSTGVLRVSGFGRPIKRYQRFRSHSEAEVAKDINTAVINYHLKNHVLVV